MWRAYEARFQAAHEASLAKLADADDAVLDVVGRYYDRYVHASAYQSQAVAS